MKTFIDLFCDSIDASPNAENFVPSSPFWSSRFFIENLSFSLDAWLSKLPFIFQKNGNIFAQNWPLFGLLQTTRLTLSHPNYSRVSWDCSWVVQRYRTLLCSENNQLSMQIFTMDVSNSYQLGLVWFFWSSLVGQPVVWWLFLILFCNLLDSGLWYPIDSIDPIDNDLCWWHPIDDEDNSNEDDSDNDNNGTGTLLLTTMTTVMIMI